MHQDIEKRWNMIRLFLGAYMTVTILAVWYCTFFVMCGRVNWAVSGLGYGHIYKPYFFIGSAVELSGLIILLAAGIALVWKGNSMIRIGIYLQWAATGMTILLTTKVVMCLASVFQPEMFYPEGVGYLFAAPLVFGMTFVLLILIPIVVTKYKRTVQSSEHT